VRVVLVDFGERHDTRTNGQYYTAADRRPTNQVRAHSKLDGEVAGHVRHARLVTNILARMSRGCYAENGRVEFKLYYWLTYKAWLWSCVFWSGVTAGVVSWGSQQQQQQPCDTLIEASINYCGVT